MSILRNPELRRELCVYAGITVLLAAVGFAAGPAGGVVALAGGALFGAAHLLLALARYRRMARLAQRAERVLHGDDAVLVSESEEGELSILASEIQKMTVRLREQSAQLAAEKLRLTDAIEDIFHQIRTPLTSMNLVVSLLGEETLPYERRLRLAHALRRQLARVSWLVETLLKLSKLDAGTARLRAEQTPVRAVVERAAAPLRIPMELREQTLTLRVGDERFTGDPDWTAEALSNLLKNCMEHTPAGGRVTVEARETALFSEIVIEDSGPGFAAEDLPYLFERFYRGRDASDESVGIGLALARRVIAEQNGVLTAANAPQGGARFTVRFYKSVI